MVAANTKTKCFVPSNRYTPKNRGKTFYPESRLYYFRNRYYSTVQERFLQRDPIGFQGSQYNLYKAYFVPNGMDPEGLFSLSGVSKSLLRRFWRAVSDRVLAKRGWSLSRELLLHSLQDSPKDPLVLSYTHSGTQQIFRSRAYRKQRDNIIRKIPADKKVHKIYKRQSIRFGSGDLFAAIHRARAFYSGEICKSSATIVTYSIRAVFNDTYNFEYWTYNSKDLEPIIKDFKLDPFLGKTANNIAHYSQKIGAIVPFELEAEFTDKK